MCGLTGYIGIEPISKLELDFLMVSNLKRGRDSAGYYDHRTSSIRKALGDADENLLIEYPITPTTAFIGHCRASTAYGTAKDANAAHPFTFKGIVLAHNGTIDNIHALKSDKPFKNEDDTTDTCDVDSKYITWRMSVDKDFKPVLQAYTGKAALIWIPLLKNKKSLMFTYHDNERPLFTGINPNTGGRVFHSIEAALKTIGCTEIYSLPIHIVTEWNAEGGIVKETTIDRSKPLSYTRTTYQGHVSTNSNIGNDLDKFTDVADRYIKNKKYNKKAIEDTGISTFAEIKAAIKPIFGELVKEASIDFVIKRPQQVLNGTDYNFLTVNKTTAVDLSLNRFVVFDDNGSAILPKDMQSLDNLILMYYNKNSELANDILKNATTKEAFTTDDVYSTMAWHIVEDDILANKETISFEYLRLYLTKSGVYHAHKDQVNRYIDLEEVGTGKILRGVNVKYLRSLSYASVVDTYAFKQSLVKLGIKNNDKTSTAVTVIPQALDCWKNPIKVGDEALLSLTGIASVVRSNANASGLVDFDYELALKKDFNRKLISDETAYRYSLITLLIMNYCSNMAKEFAEGKAPRTYSVTDALVVKDKPEASVLSLYFGYVTGKVQPVVCNLKSHDVYNAAKIDYTAFKFDEHTGVINNPDEISEAMLCKMLKILYIQSVIKSIDYVTTFKNTLIKLGRVPKSEAAIKSPASTTEEDEFTLPDWFSNEDPVSENGIAVEDKSLEYIVEAVTDIEAKTLDCMAEVNNIIDPLMLQVVETSIRNIKMAASSALEDIQEELSKENVFSENNRV